MHQNPPAVAPSGVTGLDDIMRGGFPRGRLHFILGETGTGKTTLGLHVALEGKRRGETVLYVPFAESAEELHVVARSHGWSLDGITILEIADSEAETEPELSDSLFYPAEAELTDAFQTLRNRIEELAPDRLVLDAISELKLMARDRLYYRRHLAAFKRFCGARGTTVLVIAEPQAGHDDTQSMAHSVIRLEQSFSGYGSARRRLLVSKLRGSPVRTGWHDFTIRTGGMVVYPRLAALEKDLQAASELLPSGLAPLDRLLGGGIHRATSMLIAGPAGSGKSTIAMVYAVAAAERGEPSLMCLFDEDARTLLTRSILAGERFAHHVNSGTIMLHKIDPGETCMGEFCTMVNTAIDRDGVRLVVIDTINGLLHAMAETKLLELHIHHLIGSLSAQGITTLLLMAQHGMALAGGDSPLDISYLADTIMLLRYFEANGKILRAVSVLKKRTGWHEKTIRQLKIAENRMEIGEPLTAFQGVLTGNPRYTGSTEAMIGHRDEAD